MSTLYKCEICPSCQQVITVKGKGAVEKHTDTVFKLYGCTLADIKTKTKAGYVAYARQYLWLLLVVEDEWSFPRAAKLTGHDHSTAMHGVQKLAQELLGLPRKSPIFDIIKAYWIAAGMDEKAAHAKASQRRKGGR